jgi:hypothetical protein
VPPTRIANEITRRSRQVMPALTAVAQSHAARAEAAMKSGAPWNDQTGQARQGLFGTVTVEGDSLTIHLGGTVIYQVYLELGTSKMAPRPIIVPVAAQTQAAFIRDATAVVRGLFG